jgi:Flp pilus assembly protein TadG
MTKRFSFRDQNGQAMTEFAIVLPILAFLLFAIIQFGLVFNNYLTLTDAVRAGARKAAVSRRAPDPVGAAVLATRNAAVNLRQADLTVNVTVTPSWQAGAETTVEASYPYEISLLGLVVRSGQMTSKTTERVE